MRLWIFSFNDHVHTSGHPPPFVFSALIPQLGFNSDRSSCHVDLFQGIRPPRISLSISPGNFNRLNCHIGPFRGVRPARISLSISPGTRFQALCSPRIHSRCLHNLPLSHLRISVFGSTISNFRSFIQTRLSISPSA